MIRERRGANILHSAEYKAWRILIRSEHGTMDTY